MQFPSLRMEQRREDHCPFCNEPLGIPPVTECPDCSTRIVIKGHSMIEITFDTNGKEGDSGGFVNDLTKAVLENIEDKIRAEIPWVRCPIHGDTPKFKVKGENVSVLHIEVTAFCKKFKN